MIKQNTVWVLDDDKSIRWVLEKSLNRAGVTTQTFDNGDDLLYKLEKERPDAIISDIRMPGINGLDLLSTVHEQHPLLPVIIMTAHSTWTVRFLHTAGAHSSICPNPSILKKP